MKKYILPALAAFLLACLIGGGTIRHLERKGKIRLEWSPTATAIKTRSIDRIIRELIPDSGQIYGKWQVLAHQEDPVEWEYAEGDNLNPRFGKVQLVWNDGQPIPGDWNILLKGKDDYLPDNWILLRKGKGYKSFGIFHDSISDIETGVLPILLKEGEQVELIPIEKGRQLPFVNKKAHYELYSVRLNGKAPAQLLIEYPGENNGHTLSIYGEAADFESNGEKVWDSWDDVFMYKELEKFEQPYFTEGEFSDWLYDSMKDITNFYEYYFGNALFDCTETSFIIEKDGSITNTGSYYHVSWCFGNRDPSTEQEQIIERYEKIFNSHVLKSNGKWKPGRIHGKSVQTLYKWNTYIE